MKKVRLSLVLICFMAIAAVFGGCGSKEDENNYQDIMAEKEQLSNGAEQVDTSDMLEYVHLGSQFYEEEKIQIWGERKLEGGNVYLHREDGSRELLAEGVHGTYLGGNKWWVDKDRRCFILKSTAILRINNKGSIAFETKTEEYVHSICQLEDGRIIVLLGSGQGLELAELNPEAGSLEDFQSIQPGTTVSMIAANGDGLVLLGSQGVWDMNPSDGSMNCLISFEGTSYALPADQSGTGGLKKEAFRLSEDGGIELLWSDGTAETLKLESIGAEKEVLVLRISIADSWLKEQIVKFNQENKNYYVAIDERGDSDSQSFVEQTELELGTGTGADIICSDAVIHPYALLEKGVFADLTPFMEESGLREEDFFPATFSAWKSGQKICGLSCVSELEGVWLDQTVTGGAVPSDMEGLLDYLLAYEDEATFLSRYPAKTLLQLFLQHSESLCGMVSFEDGECNFQGELFEKLLNTAKQYGYSEPKNTAEAVADKIIYNSFYSFFDSHILEDLGRIPLGYWTDDGWRTRMQSNVLAINNASPKKEGAWEFLRFLMSDEIQLSLYISPESFSEYTYLFPVSRKAFKELCAQHLEVVNYGHDIYETYNDKILNIITGLTEDRKLELEAALEGARPIPLRTQPLLEIILDEAEAYFNGLKSIDEVRELIENRVRLYLAEQK